MNESDAMELCNRWLPAWTGNTPEKLVEFYSEDAFYLDPAKPEGLRGHSELLPYFKKLLSANPNWKWEPRAVYVVEVTPKMPDYPYSTQTMYIDAETFYIPYKETYDKKGDLWKAVLIGVNESEDMSSTPPVYGGCVVVDFQSEHATLFNFHSFKANTDLDPKMFTLGNLRKRGR